MAHPTLTHTLYTDPGGRPRELVVCSGAHGSLLVLDRDPTTLCDRRLVAHIPADEPPENAALVCRMYMQEGGARLCRRLAPEDLLCAPLPSPEEEGREGDGLKDADEPLVYEGLLYGIRRHRAEQGGDAPQLRWSRRPPDPGAAWTALTLREVLAELESYEPMRSLTLRALTRHGGQRQASVGVLRRELERLQQSAFVLNRGLREAVLDAVERRGVVSMSELALRCGMVKRERRGQITGDTTWLARRIGSAPESGKLRPTRWVHSDTLGLIARRGLGVSPREVELG
jgi:hypothetical protein